MGDIGDDKWRKSQSVVSGKDDYTDIVNAAINVFKGKHGCLPIGFTEKELCKIIDLLKTIKVKYANMKFHFKN